MPKIPVTQVLSKTIRNRFANVTGDPLSGPRIYLENAGGTLRLKSIFPVVERLTALPDNSGRANPASQAVDRSLVEGRRALMAIVGAKSGYIVAEQSTTSLIFRLLRTATRQGRGNNLVTTNLDHASVFDATRIVAEEYGHECRVASLDPRTGTVPLSAIRAKVDRHTIALTVIHSSNILGTRNDVAAIVREAKRINPNIIVIIDGAQHACHGLIDVEALGADAYVCVAYKLFAKGGISFAHLTERFALLPHDNLLGKPKSAWDLGTREPAAYACMTKVVEHLAWLARADGKPASGDRDAVKKGLRVIERIEMDLMKAFLHGDERVPGMLRIDGLTVHGQTARLRERDAIFAFSVRGRKSTEVVDAFAREGISLTNRVADAYSGHTLRALGIDECLRVSACHYNTVEEVKRFLRVLARLARQNRHA